MAKTTLLLLYFPAIEIVMTMQPAIGYEHQRARDKLKASSPSTNTCMYKQLLHATVAAIRGFLTLKTQIFSFFLLSLHLFNFFFVCF